MELTVKTRKDQIFCFSIILYGQLKEVTLVHLTCMITLLNIEYLLLEQGVLHCKNNTQGGEGGLTLNLIMDWTRDFHFHFLNDQ